MTDRDVIDDAIAARDAEWRDAVGNDIFGPHTPEEAKVFQSEGRIVDDEITANKVTAAYAAGKARAADVADEWSDTRPAFAAFAAAIRADEEPMK